MVIMLASQSDFYNLERVVWAYTDLVALLAKEEIVNALTRLGELAAAEHETLQLVLVGGAVMALAYNARLSTQDVDAFILPPSECGAVRSLGQCDCSGTGLGIG